MNSSSHDGDAHSHSAAGHGHAHGHSHGHAHGVADHIGRAFGFAIALNLGYIVVEVVCGLRAGSLALLADAGHNFGDVIGLVMAWAATALARRRSTPRFTYGMRSSTILAALANSILLLVAVGGILWEAVGRLYHPAPVAGWLVVWAGLGGVLVNTTTALVFHGRHRQDLNVRGAYLHMASDAAVSLGVVVAAVIMMKTGMLWLDPAVSIVVAIVILAGTWSLLRETLQLALHAVPEAVDPLAVRRHLASLPGLKDVHDLHIWGMSTTETALSAHLVMPAGHPGDAFLESVVHDLGHRFGITHSTLQVETAACAAGCTAD